MTIKKKTITQERSIDLTGPEGNAFNLLGLAKRWAKQIGKDPDDILKRMQSSDYDHLVEVFDKEFGDIVTLYK